MEACEPLREHSWLVDAIGRHNTACGDLGEAVDWALGDMPDDFLIREFLVRNRAEVKGMVISEWNQQMFMARYAEENRLKGMQEGVIEGEGKAQHNIAINLLRS